MFTISITNDTYSVSLRHLLEKHLFHGSYGGPIAVDTVRLFVPLHVFKQLFKPVKIPAMKLDVYTNRVVIQVSHMCLLFRVCSSRNQMTWYLAPLINGIGLKMFKKDD